MVQAICWITKKGANEDSDESAVIGWMCETKRPFGWNGVEIVEGHIKKDSLCAITSMGHRVCEL